MSETVEFNDEDVIVKSTPLAIGNDGTKQSLIFVIIKKTGIAKTDKGVFYVMIAIVILCFSAMIAMYARYLYVISNPKVQFNISAKDRAKLPVEIQEAIKKLESQQQ